MSSRKSNMSVIHLSIAWCLNLFLSGIFASELPNASPIISLKTGQVRGLILESYEGKEFFAFKAIPYAKSTSGERRFQPPEPVNPWDGVFDATELGPECPQYNFVTRGAEGDENCLVINVYTPKISVGSSKELLPVLVFIHGGAFTIGTGSYGFYGPEKMIDYNVVLVTFNYRLGILGFMNTEDEVAPGNYGMLDQVLALRWVKENIANFGGNADQVTIFGESAGAASIVYHLLSPLSKGLFHRAISQSGSSINFWGHQKHPLEWAKKIAVKVDCPTNTTKVMVKCLKEKSMREVLRAQAAIQITPFTPANSAPSTEGPGGNGFLTEDPLNLMKEGKIENKVPLIIGLNELEALAFRTDYLTRIKGKSTQELTDVVFPNIMSEHLKNLYVESHMQRVIEEIRNEYLKDLDITMIKSGCYALDKLLSDTTFGIGIAQTANYLTQAKVPIWTYKYTHVGKHSLSEIFGIPTGSHAAHMDEIFLQFPFFYTQYERMNERDTKMSKILNSLWTSFAYGKNLTITSGHEPVLWQPFNLEHPSYLDLNLLPAIKEGHLLDNLKFWQETIPKLAKEYKTKDEL